MSTSRDTKTGALMDTPLYSRMDRASCLYIPFSLLLFLFQKTACAAPPIACARKQCAGDKKSASPGLPGLRFWLTCPYYTYYNGRLSTKKPIPFMKFRQFALDFFSFLHYCPPRQVPAPSTISECIFIIETKMPGNSGFFGPNAGIV